MGLKWTVLLFVGALLNCSGCLDWQGAGNFTQGNLTVIMAKINAFDRTASYNTYAAFATSISNQLNDLWAPAWNVAILYFSDGSDYDTVLYGYDFNGHWFWFNGVKTAAGKYISFVIWKDFNCVRWITTDPNDFTYKASSFNSEQTTAINSTIRGGYADSNRDVSDIWVAAQVIQDKVPTSSNIEQQHLQRQTCLHHYWFAGFVCLFFCPILCKGLYRFEQCRKQRRQPQGIISHHSDEITIRQPMRP